MLHTTSILTEIPKEEIEIQTPDRAMSAQANTAPRFTKAFRENDEEWQVVVIYNGEEQTSPLKKTARGQLFVSLQEKDRYDRTTYRDCFLE